MPGDDDFTDLLEADLRELHDLLLECVGETEAMLPGQADGYLAGTLVDPHHVPQALWLPAIWGGAAEAFPGDAERSGRLTELLLARRAQIVEELLSGGGAYVPFYDVDPLDDGLVWETWIEGFQAAMDLSGKPWDRLLKTGDEDLGAAYLGLAMYVRHVTERGAVDDALIDEAPDMIPYLVETLYRRQHGLDRVVMASAPYVAGPKIGRNEPCPCGSGKKFKKCCGG